MLAVAVTFSATAQGNKKNRKEASNTRNEKMEHARFGHDKLKTNKLDLTADQKMRMKSLNENFKDKLKELNKNENLTVKEQRERREAIINEHRSSVDAILTPEQRKELDAEKKNFDKANKGQRGERLENLEARLDLSDNQGQKIKAVNQDFRTKMQAIKKDDKLTDAQKKEQVETLQKQHNESIKAVLTEEQKNKLEDQRRNGKGRKNAK
jgi:hypothetical protein